MPLVIKIRYGIFVSVLLLGLFLSRKVRKVAVPTRQRDPIFEVPNSHIKILLYTFSLAISGLLKTFLVDHHNFIDKTFFSNGTASQFCMNAMMAIFCGAVFTDYSKDVKTLQSLAAVILGCVNGIQLTTITSMTPK